MHHMRLSLVCGPSLRLVCTLLCCGTALAAADWPLDPLDELRLQVTWQLPLVGSFRVGERSGRWDRADRVDLSLGWTSAEPSGRLSGHGGVYCFVDDRAWRSGDAQVELLVVGVGLEGGIGLHMRREGRRRRFDAILRPTLRAGLGVQDGSFAGIPVEGGSAEGQIDGLRVESSAGLDAVLRVGRRVELLVGLGVTGWYGSELESVVIGGSGLQATARLEWRGSESWARMGVGWTY